MRLECKIYPVKAMFDNDGVRKEMDGDARRQQSQQHDMAYR